MSSTEDANTHFDLGDDLSARGARALQGGDVETGKEWFRQAISAYEAGLRAAPEDDLLLRANLRLCIGARCFGLGELEKARGIYDEVVRTIEEGRELLDDGEAAEVLLQARLNRAEASLTAGDVEAARREVDEVLAEEPDHPYAAMLRERCPE